MQSEEVKTETPEITAPVEDKTITSPEPETQDQINWRKFREQREIERKQAEEANKRAAEKEAEAQALKAAMEAILNKSQPQNQRTYSDDNDETEDERIQKKINAALMEREKIYEEERRKKEHAEFPQKLAQVYNDFNQVCTQENIDYLEFHHPEMAKAFKYAPDSFDKWSDIYKAVKRYVPNTQSKKEEKKANNNLSKPQAMATPGIAQTGDTAPMQLDEKRRADNWARMQRVMRSG